jgi:hypothetical protein
MNQLQNDHSLLMNVKVGSGTNASIQLNSIIVSPEQHVQQVEQWANRRHMDKMIKCLRFETTTFHGKEIKPIMHCNVQGRPMGGGRNNWLTTLRGNVLKLNLTIDVIRRQPP